METEKPPVSDMAQAEAQSPKALIEQSEYGGLQRDARPDLGDVKEKELGDHLDTHKTVYVAPRTLPAGQQMSEMDAASNAVSPSRVKEIGQASTEALSPVSPDVESGRSRSPSDKPIAPAAPPKRRLCGLSPRIFFAILILFILVLLGAIIGGAVGGTQAKKSRQKDQAAAAAASASAKAASTTSPTASATPSKPVPPPVNAHDPLPGTSMATLAFLGTQDSNVPNKQSYRVYYQEGDGYVQEVVYDDTLGGWTNSTPIFTDARKYTGLSSFVYLNGTDRTERIYYNDQTYFLLQEKAKVPNEHDWLPRTLNSHNFKVNASSATGDNDGSLHSTVAYSTKFTDGPGARLFFHSGMGDTGGQGWVQELRWDQTSDNWTIGGQINGSLTTSQLTTTIQNDLLRLFFCSGEGTIQELNLNISDPSANYTKGITRKSALNRDDATMAALSVDNSTLLYYYDQAGDIRELNITGTPGSASEQTVELNPSKIATPSLANPVSLAVALGSLPEPNRPIYVFFTDVVSSGKLSTIVATKRPANDSSWPNNPSATGANYLPLGNGFF